MEALPEDWIALLMLVLVLGLKHGFDADHLATINGLTRHNAAAGARWSRLCGVLFSCGHGAVVIAVAVALGTVGGGWKVPAWAEELGVAISIGVLLVLGIANLLAVARAAPGEVVPPVGLRGRFLGRLQRAGHPLLVAAVGALFALSFDTMSQAALFALTATRHGGWESALALGLAFTAGMLLADGANGLWVARLLSRADRAALAASRLMSLAVGGISLLVAGFGAARYFSPAARGWSDGRELFAGLAVIALVALVYLAALRRPRLASGG